MVDSSKNSEIEVDLVPLAVIAVEIGESVDWVANQFKGHIRLDPVGLRGVPPVAAMEFMAKRYEDRKRRAAESKRRSEEAKRKSRPVAGGIPFPPDADPNLSAAEVQRLADADRPDPNRRVSPTEEILTGRFGRPRKVEVKS